MEETKNKYNVKKIIDIFELFGDILGGIDTIDYIAATPNEFSIHIKTGISMVLINELEKLIDIMPLDAVFFNENNPQLIIANTTLKDTNISNENIKYVIDFIKDCAIFICPCTGSEIHIFKDEIRIYIDQNSLIHNEYIGVYDLLEESNLIFKIVFDIQRPYISIMSWEDILDE